jgi:hypothetical protein
MRVLDFSDHRPLFTPAAAPPAWAFGPLHHPSESPGLLPPPSLAPPPAPVLAEPVLARTASPGAWLSCLMTGLMLALFA